jgi:hypothetical protein
MELQNKKETKSKVRRKKEGNNTITVEIKDRHLKNCKIKARKTNELVL